MGAEDPDSVSLIFRVFVADNIGIREAIPDATSFKIVDGSHNCRPEETEGSHLRGPFVGLSGPCRTARFAHSGRRYASILDWPRLRRELVSPWSLVLGPWSLVLGP